MEIVDISAYNTISSWSKLALSTDGIMIRVGYRGYGSGKIVFDKAFDKNVRACIAHGIPFGLYFMSQAITDEEAIEEAEFTIEQAKKWGAKLPLAFDSEMSGEPNKKGRADNLSKTARTSMVKMFCETVKDAGFIPCVYASTSWFNTRLDVSQLVKYKTWVAQYATKCTATFRVDAWQYTSNGTVDGISGRVDRSHAYSLTADTNKVKNPYPVPTRTLKKKIPMMHGDDVKWVQFNVGVKCDGWYGKDTEQAVKEYQLFHKLTVDGIVGMNTIASMTKILY